MTVETTSAPTTRAATDGLAGFLAGEQSKLLDRGTRNRLVHTPRSNKRSKLLAIVDERSDQVFDFLLRREKTMTFLPGSPSVAGEGEAAGEDGFYVPPYDDGSVTGARHTDNRLQTTLTPEALQKMLFKLQAEARTLEEEQGINVLFLAVGFLRWFEDDNSDVPREAPLILLPVNILRDSAKAAFRLQIREDDLATNLSLGERLKEFGLKLPELPESEDWKPADYFDQVEAAFKAAKPRWSIDRDGMVLGFFSFTKLLMYQDLKPDAWPSDGLRRHDLVRSLAMRDGFKIESDTDPLSDDKVRLDSLLDPKDLLHVVDADSSQARVIEMVRRGRNLVVWGPPGTGKSQTITNIIASAVHDGKTVLFVAEKKAALDVVHSRLKQSGLGPVMLELYSRGANKRAVAEELGRTLEAPQRAIEGADVVDRLRSLRNRLNDVSDMLHAPLEPLDITPYQALGTQARLHDEGRRPPEVQLDQPLSWTKLRLQEVIETANRFAERVSQEGVPASHPWRGVTVERMELTDRERLVRELKDLLDRARRLRDQTVELADVVESDNREGLPFVLVLADALRFLAQRPEIEAETLAILIDLRDKRRLGELVKLGMELAACRRGLKAQLTDAAWGIDAVATRQVLAANGRTFWRRWLRPYREAEAKLLSVSRPGVPDSLDDRLKRLDDLAEGQAKLHKLEAESGFGADALGPVWEGEETDFPSLQRAIEWLGRFKGPKVSRARRLAPGLGVSDLERIADELVKGREKIIQLLGSCAERLGLEKETVFGSAQLETLSVPAVVRQAELWLDTIDRLDPWVRMRRDQRLLVELGAGAAAHALAEGALTPDELVPEIRYAVAEQVWKAAVARDRRLGDLVGDERQRLVEQFADGEVHRRNLAVSQILNLHGTRMPRGNVGDMGVIRGETQRKRAHMPLRKLIQKAGATLQRVKPVFLMSPLSIAQFLPPGALNFDLLVIDEASQVRPEDALGAVARARQLVVVGDDQQLPPSSFFSRLTSNQDADDENEEEAATASTEGIESILTHCLSQGMRKEMLRMHYRSRHPSLIEVSNREFYDDKLFLFPAPQQRNEEGGLVLRPVRGVYDRGGKRTNEIEAKAVVAAAVAHARRCAETGAPLSLGIATFSKAQQDLVLAHVEKAARDNADFDSFIRGDAREPFFVKNLENVQGDERDIIMVSVGYGPEIAGAGLAAMNFGPVSSEGGERRLNVLFTRAKQRCEVFCSFSAGDIDLNRATGQGPRVLQRYLRFAESGILDQPLPQGGFDSDFEEAVCRALRRSGYEVDTQVGSGGYRIDMAVKHPTEPGRYLMAVECDGATYHSAPWARERDRLRQGVLESLGWKFHRVWSTDWFSNPAATLKRLRDAIEQAKSKREVRPQVQPQDLHMVLEPESTWASSDPVDTSTASQSQVDLGTVPYMEASFEILDDADLHELPLERRRQLVSRVVQLEGPVHASEVARRLTRLSGKGRAGSRIEQAVRDALASTARMGILAREGEFWMTPEQKAQTDLPVRDRSDPALSKTLRSADMLPPAEIRSALQLALRQNGSMEPDVLIVAVARLLGFQRTGQDLQTVIGLVVKSGTV